MGEGPSEAWGGAGEGPSGMGRSRGGAIRGMGRSRGGAIRGMGRSRGGAIRGKGRSRGEGGRESGKIILVTRKRTSQRCRLRQAGRKGTRRGGARGRVGHTRLRVISLVSSSTVNENSSWFARPGDQNKGKATSTIQQTELLHFSVLYWYTSVHTHTHFPGAANLSWSRQFW